MNAYIRTTFVIFLVFSASSAQAGYIILGNLPPVNDAAAAAVLSGAVHHAVSFTMPARSYPVEQVALRLNQYNTAAGDIAAVGFYLDNGSDEPGALVGSLLANPPSASNDFGQFHFTPDSPLTLAAATKYWLQVDAAAGDFAWRGSSPQITPTSQVGATFGKQINFEIDMWNDAIFVANFEIMTTIPEPSGMLVAIIAVLALTATSVRSSDR